MQTFEQSWSFVLCGVFLLILVALCSAVFSFITVQYPLHPLKQFVVNIRPIVANMFNDDIINSDYLESNVRIMEDDELRKKWQEYAVAYFTALSGNLLRGAEENHETRVSSCRVRPEIRNSHFPNASEKRHSLSQVAQCTASTAFER
jgi:hypothetical protein